MEQEFRALLTGSAAVTTIAPAASINWGDAPQGTSLPYVVLHLIGSRDELHLTDRTWLFDGRVQVDCYASTPKAAITLGDTIRDLLQGYTSGGFHVIEHDSTRGPRREAGTNDAARPYLRSMDFNTFWSE